MKIPSRPLAAAIASVALLSSCGGAADHAESIPHIDIATHLNCGAKGDAAGLFETLAVVSPSVTDSTMLGFPEIAGVSGGSIYLRDADRLAIFDMTTGRCLSSFDRSGEGPDDYTGVWSAWKDPSGSGWTVYDLNGKKIHQYTAAGTPSGAAIAMDSLGGIMPCGAGWMGINRAAVGRDKVFHFYSPDWAYMSSTDSRMPFEASDGGRSFVVPRLTMRGDMPYLHERDTLYAITQGRALEPVLAIGTGRYGKPEIKTGDDEEADGDNRLLYFLTATDRHALIYYVFDGQATFQVYRIADGDMIFSHTVAFDSAEANEIGFPLSVDGSAVSAIPLDYSDGDSFYFLVSGDSMAALTGDAEANPAVVRARLRD